MLWELQEASGVCCVKQHRLVAGVAQRGLCPQPGDSLAEPSEVSKSFQVCSWGGLAQGMLLLWSEGRDGGAF